MKKFWSVNLYDRLPEYIFANNILEIGARNGVPQLESRHRERFLNANYIGIDILDWKNESPLNIEIIDIFDFKSKSESFDLILAIAVFEHIIFSKWERLFEICLKLLKPNGYLVIVVPNNQLLGDFLKSIDYQTSKRLMREFNSDVSIHQVFSITPSVFRYFLPQCNIKKIRKKIIFRDSGETRRWACLRFIKRFFTFHPYVWHGLLFKSDSLQVIYRKR